VPSQQNPQAMADLFAQHMEAELAGDLETTLATMTDNPHLVNVPSMVGGTGLEEVRAFYADHLVGKFFPPDVEFTEVSRTLGDGRLVDELIISFTHTQEIEWMLPGVAPTGRPVSVAFVVIVGVENGKISSSWACSTRWAFPSPAGRQRPRSSTRPSPARTSDSCRKSRASITGDDDPMSMEFDELVQNRSREVPAASRAVDLTS
jgi:carboxymethylenebutenolidase